MDTPPARRPTTLYDRGGLDGAPSADRVGAGGTMRSVAESTRSPSKPSAATPITVAGSASTLIVSPMAGAFPNRRRRNASLMTTTPSSDSVKNRPADSRAPTTSKYVGETDSVGAWNTPERASTLRSPPPEYIASCAKDRWAPRYALHVP